MSLASSSNRHADSPPTGAFDVIVIGAGIGALTAAALLARRGRSVLVLERHAVAGGNATVFCQPGYQFDIGPHYVGDCGPDGLIPKVLCAAGINDIDFRELDPSGFDTLVFPDFTFRVPRGIDEYRARLIAVSERALPGLARDIVFKEVATPLTHSRLTRSTGGTSYGIGSIPSQFLTRRPGPVTDVKGLYLCGASTMSGHGIAGTMMSGVLAAAKVVGTRLVTDVLHPLAVVLSTKSKHSEPHVPATSL